MDLLARYTRFLHQMDQLGVDEFVVTHPPNLAYLFGFTGSTGVAFVRRTRTTLLVDSRYLEQAETQVKNATVRLARSSVDSELSELLKGSAPSPHRTGFEARSLSFMRAQQLISADSARVWVPTDGLVENLRMIKEAAEIALLRDAFGKAREAHLRAQTHFAPGMTELEIAGILELEIRRSGGEGTAFDTIVASGPRSSLPHGVATSRRVGPEEYLLVDFGICYRGYHSDLTRLFFFPNSRKPDILDVVQEAQAAALDRIHPGATAAEIDRAARDRIEKGGFGEYFGHGTGHGLGLEVHELPHVSRGDATPLQAGMVFTVEPGIYLPGRYGVRVEDAIVVTESGYDFLSTPDG